uniref:Uncharacterized protein n=1 Tax=uncultured marine virus TaxID=186617 RepID=A0A0F7L9H9_9VIRU|nr:hypothetical protein [uncultured marine virus]
MVLSNQSYNQVRHSYDRNHLPYQEYLYSPCIFVFVNLLSMFCKNVKQKYA